MSDNRAALLERWLDTILGSYAEDAVKFMRLRKDAFANPLGSTIKRESELLLDALLQGSDEATLREHLDPIVRIRAVQQMPAQTALQFVLELRHVVRDELGQQVEQQGLEQELLAFGRRVDSLALLAFEIYASCREKVWELRANDAKRRVQRLLDRAHRMWGDEGLQPEPGVEAVPDPPPEPEPDGDG